MAFDLAKTFQYLDRLRESGATNMYGAASYIENRFNIGEDEAIEILSKWMETFDPNLTPEERAIACSA